MQIKQLNFVFGGQVEQYDDLIYKLIKKVIGTSGLYDAAIDIDDLVQDCRIYVWEALRDYNAKAGAKPMTYIYMKLFTKLLNIKDKLKTRAKYMTDVTGDDENEDVLPIQFSNGGSEDSVIEMLDMKKRFASMSAFEKTLVVNGDKALPGYIPELAVKSSHKTDSTQFEFNLGQAEMA